MLKLKHRNTTTANTIATTSNIIATSVVKGDSLSEVIKSQGSEQLLLNTLLNAAGEVATKEIGIAYHGTTDSNGNYINTPISKPLQLTLHALTGCAIGSASGNCAAGAAGAVTGELVAETYFKNKLTENGAIIEGNKVIIDPTQTNLTLNQVEGFKLQAVELSKLAGAIAAVPFVTDDDASAVGVGSYVGGECGE